MNKRTFAGLTATGFVILCFVVNSADPPKASITAAPKTDQVTTSQKEEAKTTPKAKAKAQTHSQTSPKSKPHAQAAPKPKPTCNGTSVTTSCTVDGVTYRTYVYHAAVAEKSHIETHTTYRQDIASYCTLCADGTYSPSCATGRGACSWHGGVQEWNAPRYVNTPVNTSNTVVDAPAQAAYYEKVAQ
jgi:hypothetical protein